MQKVENIQGREGFDFKKLVAFLDSGGSMRTGWTSEKVKLRWLFPEAV